MELVHSDDLVHNNLSDWLINLVIQSAFVGKIRLTCANTLYSQAKMALVAM